MTLSKNVRSPLMHPLILFGLALILLLLTGGYLMSRMPGRSFTGTPPDLTETQTLLRQRLQSHVTVLAGDIGERHVWRPARLEAAAVYIEKTFRDTGLTPENMPYSVGDKMVRNIAVEIKGSASSRNVLVIGAHYDTVPGTPGANDNATGIAALLELARLCSQEPPAQNLRLVAFVNEEPPFFKTGQMGSRIYASALKERGDRVTGMLSLETIGYYSSAPHSQRFPLPLLKVFYPDRGNFLAFVGNVRSRQLLKKYLRRFRNSARFPSEGIIAPGWLTGVDWSDHWSFWQEGWPAIMLTDTAIFRYPHYHGPGDTPEQVDFAALTRVVSGLQAVLENGLPEGRP